MEQDGEFVDFDLLFGPEDSLAFIRQGLPAGPDWLLSEHWAAGGALIDVDRKRLMWFGGQSEGSLEIRRFVDHTLRHSWKDWRVDWARRGVAEIWQAAGGSPSDVAVPEEPDVLFQTENPDLEELLVSVKEGGRVRRGTMGGDMTALLRGPDDVVRRLATLDAPALELSATIRGGVHVDVDARFLGWWSGVTGQWALGGIRERWAGWDVEEWSDQFERQFERIGVTVPTVVPDVHEMFRYVLYFIEQKRLQTDELRSDEGVVFNRARAPLAAGRIAHVNAWKAQL